MKILLQAALLYLMSGAASSGELFDQPVSLQAAPSNFQAVSQSLNAVSVLRGKFQQKKAIAILKHPLLSNGEFVLANGRGLLWHIQQPIDVLYRINSNSIRQLKSHISRPPAMSQSMGQVFSAILAGNAEVLDDHFMLFFDGDTSRWSMGLQPHEGSLLSKAIAHIVLSGGRHIESINISEHNGDSTTLTLHSLHNESVELSPEEERYLVE